MTDIIDQPPPTHRPDLTPSWELVITDLQNGAPTLMKIGGAWTRPVVDQVITDMVKRDHVGRERYGTPLTAGNGRDHLVDAYQEALDFAVYIRTQIADGDTSPEVATLYATGIDNIIRLRAVIMARSKS